MLLKTSQKKNYQKKKNNNFQKKERITALILKPTYDQKLDTIIFSLTMSLTFSRGLPLSAEITTAFPWLMAWC